MFNLIFNLIRHKVVIYINVTIVPFINMIINNNKRLGAGLSRNKGIEQSNGKYIAFIDADDTWTSDKLKDQISFMKQNGYQISHTSYFIIDEKKKNYRSKKSKRFTIN